MANWARKAWSIAKDEYVKRFRTDQELQNAKREYEAYAARLRSLSEHRIHDEGLERLRATVKRLENEYRLLSVFERTPDFAAERGWAKYLKQWTTTRAHWISKQQLRAQYGHDSAVSVFLSEAMPDYQISDGLKQCALLLLRVPLVLQQYIPDELGRVEMEGALMRTPVLREEPDMRYSDVLGYFALMYDLFTPEQFEDYVRHVLSYAPVTSLNGDTPNAKQWRALTPLALRPGTQMSDDPPPRTNAYGERVPVDFSAYYTGSEDPERVFQRTLEFVLSAQLDETQLSPFNANAHVPHFRAELLRRQFIDYQNQMARAQAQGQAPAGFVATDVEAFLASPVYSFLDTAQSSMWGETTLTPNRKKRLVEMVRQKYWIPNYARVY